MSADDLLTLRVASDHAHGAPIDVLERYFGRNGWESERHGDEEIVANVDGAWGRYELRALWREDDHVLQVVAMPGLAVPPAQRAHGYELAGRINEQLWLGHFDVWSGDGQVLFRHAALLASEDEDSGPELSVDQAEAFVEAALDECDRYFPAFNFVIEGEHDASQALAASLIDVAGEA